MERKRVQAQGQFSVWGKASRILLVLAFAAALEGCEPVQSVYPFFEPKDLVLDADLFGTWVSKEKDGSYTKMRFQSGRDRTVGYDVEAIFHDHQPRENEPDELTIQFGVHLFQVGESLFADFYPFRYSANWGSRTLELEVGAWPFSVPTHTVYLVKGDKSQLQLAWLDDEKVKNFIEKNHLSLASERTDFVILTGKTEELKASLLVQAEKEDLLDDTDLEFTREE